MHSSWLRAVQPTAVLARDWFREGLLRADWSIAPCWIDQRDPTTVAAEVVLVECEQALLGMREHRRHDIGVMDLASRNWNRSTQLGQQVGDMGSVFQDVELRYEPVNVPECSRHWQWR